MRAGRQPFHIPTVAQEVFDVSGAGDTVIASFTLAIAAGASPMEAALLSNHAAGIVVGKLGTATVAPDELVENLRPVMSKITGPRTIREMKGHGIASLTAYDYPTARLLDEAGIPLILVGDSLGNVVLGYPDTTHVTMADMEHHVRAAARAKPSALLAADMPFGSYETVEMAVSNAHRLADAGAEAVKAEGGRRIAAQVKAIVAAGIPFIGHLGMLPQHILEEGGYHVKGKTEPEHRDLLADADALVEAGAFAVVLELVVRAAAQELTKRLPIPTIGIGSGVTVTARFSSFTTSSACCPGCRSNTSNPSCTRERTFAPPWRNGAKGSWAQVRPSLDSYASRNGDRLERRLAVGFGHSQWLTRPIFGPWRTFNALSRLQVGAPMTSA